MEHDDLLEHDLEDYLGAPVPIVASERPGPDGDLNHPEPVETVMAAPDKDYADRLLWRSRRLAAEASDIRALADRRRAEIAEWEADRLSGITRDAERVRQSLELFMRGWHRENPKAPKSLTLSNGTLKLRAPSANGRVLIENPAAVVAFAEEAGRRDVLKYEPKPILTQLRDAATLHAGPQQIIDGALCHTWRLMIEVPAEPDPDGKVPEGGVELVTVPGVLIVKPVEDKFDLELTEDHPSEQEEI